MKRVITLSDLKTRIHDQIKINKFLSSIGELPLSITAIGESGIGKTSAVLDIAKEENLPVFKFNLADLSDTSDLIGFPIVKDENGKRLMTYAIPEWVDKLNSSPSGGFLFLDDYNRSSPKLLNSIMEIVDRREFYSWKLNDNILVILSGNPDDSDYNVTSEDEAQKTRSVNYYITFNIDDWVKWADKKALLDVCIDFMSTSYTELIGKMSEFKTNARQWGKFFISLRESDLEDIKSLSQFGYGCVGNQIDNFIAYLNSPDRCTITMKDLLTKNFELLKEDLMRNLYVESSYKYPKAAVLLNRLAHLINNKSYVNMALSTEEVAQRVYKLFVEKDLFKNDLQVNFLSLITNNNIDSVYQVLVGYELVYNVYGNRTKL